MKIFKTLKNDQRGLAALTITLFILIVLTLVMLAFSQIARREQRQSLDRQLSDSARNVAESGINDTIRYVRDPANQIPLETMDYKRDDCSEPLPSTISSTLDDDTGGNAVLRLSCILFDRAPSTLEYSAIDTYRGELISLRTSEGPSPNSVTFEWHDTDGGSIFTGCAQAGDAAALITYPTKETYSANCDAGMLKLLFMPVNNDGSITREELVDDSFSVYLRPVNGSPGSGNTVSYQRHANGPNTQGFVVPADCGSGKCKVTINNIPTFSGLYLRISSIYNNSATTITGATAANPAARFSEAQIMIDSTGRANDVLKRLQARVPLYERYDTPRYVLESMNGICKRLGVYPTNAAYPGYADNSDCGGIN